MKKESSNLYRNSAELFQILISKMTHVLNSSLAVKQQYPCQQVFNRNSMEISLAFAQSGMWHINMLGILSSCGWNGACYGNYMNCDITTTRRERVLRTWGVRAERLLCFHSDTLAEWVKFIR